MADISTFDNFFDKFPPKSGFQTNRRNMALKRHKGTPKKSEIASEFKLELKYLFHFVRLLYSLYKWIRILTGIRINRYKTDFQDITPCKALYSISYTIEKDYISC